MQRHPLNTAFEWQSRQPPFRRVTREQADQFDRDGFVVIDELIDATTGYECFEEPPCAQAAPVNAGGAVVFSSLMPHLTGPNTTGAVRKAYIVQYAPTGAYTRTDDGDVLCDDPDRQFPVLRNGERV